MSLISVLSIGLYWSAIWLSLPHTLSCQSLNLDGKGTRKPPEWTGKHATWQFLCIPSAKKTSGKRNTGLSLKQPHVFVWNWNYLRAHRATLTIFYGWQVLRCAGHKSDKKKDNSAFCFLSFSFGQARKSCGRIHQLKRDRPRWRNMSKQQPL